MANASEVDYFARLVEALEPWLDRVVIIGGWAHRLYRLHPLAQPLDYEPLGTFDADVAVPLASARDWRADSRAAACKRIPRRADGRHAASGRPLSRSERRQQFLCRVPDAA